MKMSHQFVLMMLYFASVIKWDLLGDLYPRFSRKDPQILLASQHLRKVRGFEQLPEKRDFPYICLTVVEEQADPNPV